MNPIPIFFETVDAAGKVVNTNPNDKRFQWQHLPYAIRPHYNSLLRMVTNLDASFISPVGAKQARSGKPNYYNNNFCLALGNFEEAKEKKTTPDRATAAATAAAAAAATVVTETIITAPKKSCITGEFFTPGDLNICGTFFKYERHRSTDVRPKEKDVDLSLSINGLTVGSVLWLYYYERMGIFKILGALMDDYNYRGKYPISNTVNGEDFANQYSTLMENISLLYRLGIASNMRDRVCVYQRVLGLNIESNMEIKSERNDGFMRTFNKLIDYMLEYYKAKQLAQAIQSTNQNGGIRSSVATQTSIRDTMQVLQQQFESAEYGRNPINTFIGIATVYATLCLLRLVKDEIGIPRQYERPEEFVPAAYDILVLGRPVTPSESNRFIIYDNCATYGYRLLTDLELLNLNVFATASQNSPLDQWLDDVEGIVEGYRNAFAAVPENSLAL